MDNLNTIAVDYLGYITKTNDVPSFIKKAIVTGLNHKTIRFTNKVLDKGPLVTYYGVNRVIYFQFPNLAKIVHDSKDPELDLNLIITAGIVSRAVLKYHDIYGLKLIDEFFGDFLKCYFYQILFNILKPFTDRTYITRDLADLWTDSYVYDTDDIAQYYYKTGRLDTSLVYKFLEKSISSMLDYMENEMSLPEPAFLSIKKKLTTELQDLPIFYNDMISRRYYSMSDIQKNFKKCLEFPFNAAPLISYIPSRELKIPVEILARLMELYVYAQEVDRFNSFVKFFIKVL